MTVATSVRAALKTSLAPVIANIYDHVPENPITPHVSILPDDPYFVTETISKSAIRVRVNMLLVCGVTYVSNPSSLDNLEQLAINVLKNIPLGYILGEVSRPTITQVGSSNQLTVDIRVSAYYTQSI
jgi:hypothetical protein